jgi:amino acid transporter
VIDTLRRVVLGRPLPSSASRLERLSIPRAMGAFGLDSLSSVAYGPDEILYVLLLAGAAGTQFDLPITLAIALLLVVVATSYRQTIYAYPRGGGSFTVARENLGVNAGLTAAAALMVDYLTTVAVSVTAGVAALTAVWPGLDAHRVLIDVGLIVILVFINLRGVREAGAAFALPTYLFVGSIALLLVVGTVHLLIAGRPPPLHPIPRAMEGVSLFLVLRAFAGGCTAMTGVEAIANGVPAFRKPESRNAARTLTILAAMLGTMFIGIAGLGLVVGAVPSDQSNVLAQVGQAFAGGTPLFFLVQGSAALVLLLAANTSFNGFPRLAAVMAEEDWLPHQFTHRGMRLAYSNGIITIGVLGALLIIVFGGSTHALIPLYAVGVFLCFTLSQAGMVRHWIQGRTRGRGWRAAVNGTGALVTGVVTVIVVTTKFTSGAWIVLVVIPFLVANFHGIHAHYRAAAEQLKLDHRDPLPPSGRRGIRVVVPAGHCDRATAQAIDYARTISDDVTVVHFATGETREETLRKWRAWCGADVKVLVLRSPYREVVEPLVALLERWHRRHPAAPLAVVLPEVIPRHFWERPLHNQMALVIKLGVRRLPNVVVKSVPTRLER